MPFLETTEQIFEFFCCFGEIFGKCIEKKNATKQIEKCQKTPRFGCFLALRKGK
nr:hypothetical protein [uncultured Dysosmobacter sp.]